MAITQLVKDGVLVDASASATSLSTSKTADSNSLDKDAFLQLLVAQMKYQDPLEPTDNTQYISQLATFSQLEATQNVQSSLSAMEANDLVGKQVILKVTSSVTGETSYVSGRVDYVLHENGETYLSVNDALYSIEDLDTVADSDYMDAVTFAKSFNSAVRDLPSVDNVAASDEEKVTTLYTAYQSLTDYQKQFVAEDDVKKLESLIAKIALLKAAEGNQGEGSETEAGAEAGADTGAQAE
ncbi:MAG: flagellar hook capping protein [Lachnospiraceae bacterium]|nr:flagellar hook capping protein [Lachnospiraceae bacterium]